MKKQVRKKSDEIQKSDARKRSNSICFTEIYEALSNILIQLEKASKLSLDILQGCLNKCVAMETKSNFTYLPFDIAFLSSFGVFYL